MAYTALDEGLAQAAIAFSPTVRTTACPISGEKLISGAHEFGTKAHLKTLWFYGETDHLVPTGTWSAMIRAYTAQGAPLTVVNIGNTLPDSHALIGSPHDFRLWIPALDRFLASRGMPTDIVQPRYMPQMPEPASHFADVTDVSAVPYLNARGQDKYREFLAMKLPRGVAIAPNGSMAASSGGSDPAGESLARCQRANLDCALYATDNDVVWKGARRQNTPKFGPPPQPHPLQLVKSVAAGGTISIAFANAMGLDCKPLPPPGLKLVQPGLHGHIVFCPDRGVVHFPETNFRSICNGKTTPGTRIEYTADQGYVGVDHMVIDSKEGHFVQHIDVTVKVF